MSTTTDPEAPSRTVTAPTSRLHAATNALARWDHATGSGEDIGNDVEVLQEHWQGAREVWDALQPRYSTTEELEALTPLTFVIIHSRYGPSILRRSNDCWFVVVREGVAVTTGRYSSEHLLELGDVRLLWEPR